MKVAILQWSLAGHPGHGTIERISTTGADCVKFFKMQISALGYKSFKASEEGYMALENEDLCQFPDFIIRDSAKLQQFVQSRLDADLLGNLSILAYNKRDMEDTKRFSIQFRNVH